MCDVIPENQFQKRIQEEKCHKKWRLLWPYLWKKGKNMDQQVEHIVKPLVNTIQISQDSSKKEQPILEVSQETEKIEDIPQEEKKESRWDAKKPLSDPYSMDDPLFYKVADYFGLNARSADFNKNKIIEIMNWGKDESLLRNDGDILLRIKELEQKLNILPGMAEQRHTILYRYIVLSKQKINIEKEMGVWENHGN